MRGYEMSAGEIQDRLRRIGILTQLNSISAAVRAVGLGLLDDHVRRCIAASLERGEDQGKVDELVAAVAMFAGHSTSRKVVGMR